MNTRVPSKPGTGARGGAGWHTHPMTRNSHPAPAAPASTASTAGLDPVEEIAVAATTLKTVTANLSGAEQSVWSAHQHQAAGDWSATKTHTVHTVRNPDGDNVFIANSGRLAVFVATMGPELALALAAWLDDESVGAQTPTGEPTAHAVNVARIVNAAAAAARKPA